MERVPYEQLVDLAEGRLSPTEAAELRLQLATDPVAQQRLAELEQLIGLMRRDDSVDAPAHLIARAVRIAHQAASAPAPRLMQRLTALITSDSWRMPQLTPQLRSLHAWPRAILLRAGDHELDLQVTPNGEQWQLRGQLLGPEAPGTVTLSGSAVQVSAPLNDLGEFSLPLVPSGRYTLTVHQDQLEIVVPNLEFGPLASMQ